MRKSVLKKTAALLMCIMMLFSSSACNLAEQIRNSLHVRITIQHDISVQEMTRLIVSAINDKRNTADVYSQIPSDQNDGLSYSYFYEYMNILRTVSTQDNNGKVVSFRIMSDDECLNLLGGDLINRYGQIKGAELMYSSDVEYPLYIFFSVKENGEVTLSKDWVTSIINIYNYSNHYFTLLDESNADAVKALLMPGFNGEEYTDEVVYAKAQMLCEFYRLRVMSNINEYEITRLVPGQMTVRIPETIAAEGDLFEDHIVSFTYQNGVYNIDDKINAANDINLVYLVRGDERLIRAGNEYSYSQLNSVIGSVPSTFSYDPDNNMIIVIYSDLVLRFDDVVMTGEDWEGSLTSIHLISSSIYSLGYNLYPGMTRSQVLMAYPFADETGYTITVNSGANEYEVTILFSEDGTVESVKVMNN
ncbi:MAG: hypothetical protein ILA15_07405 [Clostridiales bacterium]|nr:hypothetical protein [Clostridiales bacterium]